MSDDSRVLVIVTKEEVEQLRKTHTSRESILRTARVLVKAISEESEDVEHAIDDWWKLIKTKYGLPADKALSLEWHTGYVKSQPEKKRE